MSEPSYLPDDSELSAETDNSHLFGAEIADFSPSEVDPSGLSVKIPSAHDIESALSALRTENPSPRDKFGLPGFANMVLMAVSDSEAGRLARHGFWLVDKYHATNAETMGQWDFTAEISNARIDGKSVADRLEQSKETVFDSVYKLEGALNALKNDEVPDYDDYESARDSDLWDMVEYAVWWKTVYQVYMGARVEELAGDVLKDAFDLGDWVAQSEKVRAETGVENPETAGIDLYFPEADLKVQVKRGDGGEVEGDYDWLVRYQPPQTDGSGRDATLEVSQN